FQRVQDEFRHRRKHVAMRYLKAGGRPPDDEPAIAAGVDTTLNNTGAVLDGRMRLEQQMPTAAAGNMCARWRQLRFRIPSLLLDVLQVQVQHDELFTRWHANQRSGKVRPQYAHFVFIGRRVLEPSVARGPLVL